MIRLNNLGTFDNLDAVWEAFPEGGVEGDYVVVEGHEIAWNKYTRNWGSGTTESSPSRKTHRVNGSLIVGGDVVITGRFKVYGDVELSEKGLFLTSEDLINAIPNPEVGDWAAVGSDFPAELWVCRECGVWEYLGGTYDGGSVKVHLVDVNPRLSKVIQIKGIKKIRTLKISPTSNFVLPLGAELPYVGIQTFMRGKWSLITQPLGMDTTKNTSLPQWYIDEICAHVKKYTPNLIRVDETGVAEIDIKAIFELEFMPLRSLSTNSLSAITYHNYDKSRNISDVFRPRTMEVENVRVFTRGNRNKPHAPFPNNPLTIAIRRDNDVAFIKVDLTKSGYNQVLKRKYRIGYIYPNKYYEDGLPNWKAGYVSSTWAEVECRKKINLYKQESNEDNIQIRIL